MKMTFMNLPSAKVLLVNKLIIVFFCIFHLISFPALSQFSNTGYIKGIIYNAATGQPMGNVNIQADSNLNQTSFGDGHFVVKLKKGKHMVKAFTSGFQTKFIENVIVMNGETLQLNIFLFPLSVNSSTIKLSRMIDSVGAMDTVFRIDYVKEVNHRRYSALLQKNHLFDFKAVPIYTLVLTKMDPCC